MNTLSKSLLAMGLAVLMAAPASAQQQRRGGGGFGGFGGGRGITGLLSNTGVQEELKLDDSQKSKVGDIADKAREKFRSATEGLEGQERFAKVRELTKEVDADAKKALADVLKPEQVTRLKQIHVQTLGASAFEEEHIQKKLELTAEQKSAIESIVADGSRAQRELFQSGDRESAMAKFAEIRKETLSKAEAKLTDAQKATYKELLGAPYEVRFERRGPGR